MTNQIETLYRKAATLTNHADKAEMKAFHNGTRDLPEVGMRLAIWRTDAREALAKAISLDRQERNRQNGA